MAGGTSSSLADGFNSAPSPTPEHPLDAAHALLTKYISLPSKEAADAVTLWVAVTHVYDAFDATPRLNFCSPERRTGKTRALEVLEHLVARPVLAAGTSTAALFRAAETDKPTILFDEVDTIFGPKAKDQEDLRGLLNAGYRASGTFLRCIGEGKDIATKEFHVFRPVAFAGIGNLPDTLADRSIHVHMKRQIRGQGAARYRSRIVRSKGEQIAAALASWLEPHRPRFATVFPDMPEDIISDGAEEIWEPLIAAADLAGGDWARRSRAAVVALAGESDSAEASLGIRLLRDIRLLWPQGQEHWPSSHMVTRLHQLEESPWAGLGSTGVDPLFLARKLGGYGIHSKGVRGDWGVRKGYSRSQFEETWARYCPTPLEKALRALQRSKISEAIRFRRSTGVPRGKIM